MSLLHTTYRVFSERRGISFLLYCRAPQSRAKQSREQSSTQKNQPIVFMEFALWCVFVC